MVRRRRPFLQLDIQDACRLEGGAARDDLRSVRNQLAQWKDQALGRALTVQIDEVLGGEQPDAPPDSPAFDLLLAEAPERWLGDYRRLREESVLGEVLNATARLADSADRVVFWGAAGDCLAAELLTQACCQPYFNHLSRADRGGRPRLFFTGPAAENDSVDALMRVVGAGTPARPHGDRWALILRLDDLADPAWTPWVAALKSTYGDPDRLREHLVILSDRPASASRWARFLASGQWLVDPTLRHSQCGVFSTRALTPAALLGLDVMSFLDGAIRVNEHVRQAASDENLVFQWVALATRLEPPKGTTQGFRFWSEALRGVAQWLRYVRALHAGRNAPGCLADIGPAIRWLPSSGLPGWEEGAEIEYGPDLPVGNLAPTANERLEEPPGWATTCGGGIGPAASGPAASGRALMRPGLETQIWVEACRSDPIQLPGGSDSLGGGEASEAAGSLGLPDLGAARFAGFQERLRRANRPFCTLRIPLIHEFYVGQLIQFLYWTMILESRILESRILESRVGTSRTAEPISGKGE